ncbi:sporulation integral membrane protein YlbJ [Robertmurraya yapensis]|uniref:Sporulation integral membrane protein YlbJ n=1 Tax=Bacillus yapensis TaxID=2492960 RepID=A0A3S0IVI6_9BACI|nr:sporulation integral membrane protein YlbJ [Bacillus yapensis]RTR32437.1 sporulation integral membrane protein YlbJ [Bacillus yapensis]TKS96631.1 sporulation integral membrane protein YlbJ [Bacillus yapensis]
MVKSKLKTIILATSVTILAISLISFPQESVGASIRGLDMWWKIVFPSLLPFFIVSEMLIGFGVVKFVGVLLEPLMRPLFRVPGVGGFVWAMGMASGYPAGAKLTARLRQEEQLSKIEAERLVTFTNCSNPLFIFGAVSVGFFNNPKLGVILALAHYLGNLTVGIFMRFYGRDDSKSKESKSKKLFSLRTALRELHQTRIKDNRPIGKLLGDSVMSSIQTLLMIGGFIILFSVINQLLSNLHIIEFLASIVEVFLRFIQLPDAFSIPLISGLFEITLGNKLTSQVQDTTLMYQAIIASMILAFSGFSVQAQVASILAQTDINFKPFFIARIFHSMFAGLYTLLLWKPVYEKFNTTNETTNAIPVAFFEEQSVGILEMMKDTGPLLTILSLMVYILIYAKKTNKNEH